MHDLYLLTETQRTEKFMITAFHSCLIPFCQTTLKLNKLNCATFELFRFFRFFLFSSFTWQFSFTFIYNINVLRECMHIRKAKIPYWWRSCAMKTQRVVYFYKYTYITIYTYRDLHARITEIMKSSKHFRCRFTHFRVTQRFTNTFTLLNASIAFTSLRHEFNFE